MRWLGRATVVAGCVGMGGCVIDDGLSAFVASTSVAVPTEAVAPAPIPSPMPWQLTPASTASIAQGETTIIVANPRFGKVKGTPIAVANLDKPVIAFAPRGRVVAACKSLIEPQAKRIGAYSVQAAASGPEKRKGVNRAQQVFFRVIYDHPDYLEVRQSALICTVDPRDKVLDAHPV